MRLRITADTAHALVVGEDVEQIRFAGGRGGSSADQQTESDGAKETIFHERTPCIGSETASTAGGLCSVILPS
jgi:hypothetical protein